MWTAPFRSRDYEHRNLRLHHHRRRLGGLRAGQPPERRSVGEGAAARGRRFRLAPVLPPACGLREDDQGHRLVGLAHRAAEAPEGPRPALHAGQGDRRRLVDQCAALYPRGVAADYDEWVSREVRPAGRTATCCPISSAPRTTSATPTSTTVTAGRWAYRIRSARCRSARPSSRPGRNWASPSTRTSTARIRKGSATTSSRNRMRAARRPRSAFCKAVRSARTFA